MSRYASAVHSSANANTLKTTVIDGEPARVEKGTNGRSSSPAANWLPVAIPMGRAPTTFALVYTLAKP